MTLRVQFFGRPSDIFGSSREIEIPAAGLALSELRSLLLQSEPEAVAVFERYGVRAAVDNQIASGDVLVTPGQTVEFFSMFSGG
jgi:molybdopterin converting factor small subunit